jgi:hypothetical protein
MSLLADQDDADREVIIDFKDGYVLAQLPLSVTEQDMVSHVLKKLEGAKDYKGKVAEWFNLLVVRLCKFLCHRNDMGVVKGYFAYLKRVDDRTKLPHESELQLDLLNYLRATYQAPLIEVSHVAGGRADIYISFEHFRFVIEVKRSTAPKWSLFSVRPHSRQALSYTTSDVRLSVLATLDLSVRDPGDPHISSCFGVIRRLPTSTDVRTAVVMRVPGNRLTPSTLS